MDSKVLSYSVGSNRDTIAPVIWENIDVEGMPNGYYMFTYVTEDEFGNRGISILNYLGGTVTRKIQDIEYKNFEPVNPYRLKIATGQLELQ
jgi:hypothetical protein